jgi:integrase
VQQRKRAALWGALADVLAAIDASGVQSEAAAWRFVATSERFVSFCVHGHGVRSLAQVTPQVVEAFIRAPVGGRPIGVARMHSRRAVLRTLFRFARELGLVSGDPSLDVRLPAKSTLATRPLTDDEVMLCRSYSLTSLTETRHAAAWALAETTARTCEIPNIRACDVDLSLGRVWIHGGGRTPPRWGRLSSWAAQQLGRRIEFVGSDAPLVYAGVRGGESAQASSSSAIADALRRAGLETEPDVRPLSVTAWAGVTILRETGRIDEVARRLGMRSLDRAAALIGWQWGDEAIGA